MRGATRSTPSSQRSIKPLFQTKLKHRAASNSRAVNDSLLRSLQNQAKSTPPNRYHDHAQCTAKEDNFHKTASKITENRFIDHESNNCLCGECTCGRHLCQFKPIKPDFKKTTVYQQQFQRKSVTPNIVLQTPEYDKLKGPHLEMNSTYSKGFVRRQGDLMERQKKPQDLLCTGGPSSQLTSYAHQFPGHKGGNQYVKPTDSHAEVRFPFRSKSTYTSTFIRKEPQHESYRPINLLKTGSNWIGQSTYRERYGQQNPEYYPLKVKQIDKQQQATPGFKRQYQTIYRSDFVEKESPICRAKKLLQGPERDNYDGMKSEFQENSDFKTISANYHSISTDKCSVVNA